MKKRYDLVIFDLDGTLADTKRDLAAATNHTMQALGLPLHAPEKIASFVGGGLTLLLQRALGPELAKDPQLVEKAASIFKPWYREHMLDETRPYEGIDSVLDRLRDAGVKMSVATNKPRMFTAGIVEALFPLRFDPIVACADDAPRKPDPTCVAVCRAKHPQVAQERILFVGDSVVDVDTARNAGVDALSVTWGFQPREQLLEAKPRWIRDHVPEILDVVLEGA